MMTNKKHSFPKEDVSSTLKKTDGLYHSDSTPLKLTEAEKGDFILKLQGHAQPTERQRAEARLFVKAWCTRACFKFLVMHVAGMNGLEDKIWNLRFEG